MNTPWEVNVTGRAKKQQKALPPNVNRLLDSLIKDLEQSGPNAPYWPHYAPLKDKKGYFHSHLKKGHPYYVAVWRTDNNENKTIEVRYVGTHEGINYSRIN